MQCLGHRSKYKVSELLKRLQVDWNVFGQYNNDCSKSVKAIFYVQLFGLPEVQESLPLELPNMAIIHCQLASSVSSLWCFNQGRTLPGSFQYASFPWDTKGCTVLGVLSTPALWSVSLSLFLLPVALDQALSPLSLPQSRIKDTKNKV